MARTPMKHEATRVPAHHPLQEDPATLESAEVTSLVPERSPVRVRLIAPPAGPNSYKLEPIPAAALEGLGMYIVGMVQIPVDGGQQVVPVGLAPFGGSDTEAVPRAGFFTDELGRCGILLNGSDGSWQKALPDAVEEARRALAPALAS